MIQNAVVDLLYIFCGFLFLLIVIVRQPPGNRGGILPLSLQVGKQGHHVPGVLLFQLLQDIGEGCLDLNLVIVKILVFICTRNAQGKCPLGKKPAVSINHFDHFCPPALLDSAFLCVLAHAKS